MLAPSLASRPAPSLDATDDLGRILRVVGDHQPALAFSYQRKPGDCRRFDRAGCPLDWPASWAAAVRPGVERRLAVAYQLAEHWHSPSSYCLAQDRKAQSVDLHDEQARLRFLGAPEVARDQPPDQHAVIGIVVAHRHELCEEAVENRQQHGSQSAVASPSTRTPGTTRPRARTTRNWTARPRAWATKIGNPTSSPWRTTAEELSRASRRKAGQQERDGSVDLQPGRTAAVMASARQAPGRTGPCGARSPGGSVAIPTSGEPGAGRARASCPGRRRMPAADLGRHRPTRPARAIDSPGCKTRTSTSGARAATAFTEASPGPSNWRPATRRRPSG